MNKQHLTAEQIEQMGVTLLRSFTDAGNTIVTNKEGVDKLKTMDAVEEFKSRIKMTIMKAKKQKKPHHKYPSNYTPSSKRNRKK